MGEVYRARDPRLGREVAIKVVTGDGVADPARRARFEQEARAAAALNHPHILAVHDVGVAEIGGAATPSVVSELLAGETLRERLTRGPVPARTAIDLGGQIARGLAAAHEHGIVHRDVKPENLFVTKDGTAKVLDFGLAKLRDASGPAGDGDTTAEARGHGPRRGIGRGGHIAPEQVRAGAVDHRARCVARTPAGREQPDTEERSGRPCQTFAPDGPSVPYRLQRERQIPCRLKPLRRVLLQAPAHDPLQPGRPTRHQRRQVRRLSVQNRVQRLHPDAPWNARCPPASS
jgi:serine/threonine protein kinase